MERNWLIEKIQNYLNQKLTEEDKKFAKDTLQFIQKNSNCFLRSNTEGHITGSSLLFSPDKKKILLTHHKKLNKWIQLGGHSDGNSNTLEVALQEAIEESGIKTIESLNEDIFSISIHKIPTHKDTKEHLHYDILFAFLAKTEDFEISDESFDLKWFAIDELGHSEAEQSIKELKPKIIQLLKALHH